LGGPVNRSLSEARGTNGSGISGELNANRVGTGVGVDAAQDDLWGGYLAALNRAVEQNWQRVAVAATRRTKIRFQVDRQGRLTDLKLVEPSGDDTADQAAIQAVRTAAPFAPLPQNASEDVLIVNFTFTQWLTPASP
jgi:TonB family protein